MARVNYSPIQDLARSRVILATQMGPRFQMIKSTCDSNCSRTYLARNSKPCNIYLAFGGKSGFPPKRFPTTIARLTSHTDSSSATSLIGFADPFTERANLMYLNHSD